MLAVFPRNTGKDDGAKKIQKDKIDKVNSIISKLDDGGKSVKFLDIGSKFKDASGALPKELMPDQLHLSEKGYEIWANAVEGVITSMLKGDSAKAVEPTKKVEPATAAKPTSGTPEPTKTVKKVEPTPAGTPEPAKPVKKGEPEPTKTVKKVEPTPAGTPEPAKPVKKGEPEPTKKGEPAPAPKNPEPVKETKKGEPAPAVKAPAKSSKTVVKEEVVEVKKTPIRDFFRKLLNR